MMAKITSKELTAIGDTLSMEQNLIKKYNMFAAQATDQTLKQKCTQIAQQHQQHFDTLKAHLN
jgi:rubrerythrin